ncbi:MAG: TetR/AcrR family transcriptional regulator [Bacteroidota bacterium]|nr:TetR/AcrR family transcriptional regulator [Bacteroidota bacterium]
MKHGIKTLTMDEIAKGLGMSKKTIYQFVDNKSELVKLTLSDYLDEERSQLEIILKNSSNSVEEMIKMIEYFLQVLGEFNATALYDLQMYYPETWDMFNDYRFNFMLGCINDNLQNGVKQGYYRKDLKTEIIAKIYILGVETLFNQDLFPAKQFAFLNIYREYLNYHLRGIVSAKGLKYIEQHNLFKS